MAMPCTRVDDDVYEEFTKLVVDPNLLCHTQLQDSSPSIMIPLNIKGDSVPIQDITLNLISLISTVCGNLS